MKNLLRIVLVLVLIVLLSFSLKAQSFTSKLEKNKHIDAKTLVHRLNKTGDTLLLKSDKTIDYLYSINKDYGRELDLYVNANDYKLPLNGLSYG